ncbi:MAG: endonuclease domain-containing protein, partial [Methylovulum sp.]
MSKHDDLVKKLKEIFQIDKPELDFGVYRILNARVVEINDYLENRLKFKVVESLSASGAANKEGVQKELKEKEAQYRADGIDPETVPKVRELRQKLTGYSVGSSEHENVVFTHLLTFFSRYYDNGDFISQRRYKGDTYAIPYSGEEVVLHWANKDQYYTKSGENFSNYAFKLDDGRSVRFRLVTADTAKDNRKDNDKERRFVLIEPHTRTLTDDEGEDYEETLLPITEENNELVLRFEYKATPKGTKQETLVLDAVKKVLADSIVKARWLDLNKREPTEKNPQRTLLEKCLTNYTAKNSADYFIHKDLGGFLRRELDFYIKNEVMHLDDVQNAEKFADIEKNLRLIQTLRAIALDLVTFLAQLEDFQKKLWLKKKFVVATHYCITLDRVPVSLYPTIAANSLQWEQWKNLGMLEAFPPSPHRGEGRGEGQNNPQIKTRTKTERSEILNTFAQEMRHAPTETEARMWYFLRNRRLGGWKFRRQHPLGKYIADFICVDARLVIELDGGQHADLFAQQGDEERSAFLAERGLRVLRFWNNDFLQQTETVLEQILLALDESVSPHPNPLPGGERALEHKAHSILGQDNKTVFLSGSDNKPLSRLEPGNKALPHLKPSNEVLAPSGRGLGEGQEQITYLKENPYLMVDTALFDAAFKYALLATVDSLDDSLDGLLI